MSKFALISGGTGGIGSELCRAFHKRGYKVIATAPAPFQHELDGLARDFGAITFVCDLTKVEDIKALVGKVQAHTSKLDVLYNNGGIAIGGPGVVFDDDDLERVYRINVLGHVYMTKYFADMVIAAKGTIVFTLSVAARVPLVWTSHYNATKAAIDQYARTINMELRPFGVNVYSVITGGVDTPIAQRISLKERDKLRALVENLPYNIDGMEESATSAAGMTSDGTPPRKYAENVVSLIVKKKHVINLYKGYMARNLHNLGRYAPEWLTAYILSVYFKANIVFRNIRRKVAQQEN